MCGYCDFYKQVCRGAQLEYLEALEREMRREADFLGGERLDTVYFGGGTPSLYSPILLSRLVDIARSIRGFNDDIEITLEANPDDVDRRFIDELRDSLFNRVSMGVQSFDDSVLRFMNRRHTATQAKNAVGNLRKAGVNNISIDLIYGVPNVDAERWTRDIEQAVELEVEHISAYHLTIEQGTAFGVRVARGELRPVTEAVSESEYSELCQRLGEAGFEHYEISNFARSDEFRSRHNSAYWSGAPYLGLGASAHSYNGDRTRRMVVADAQAYIERAGFDDIYESEYLTDDDLYNEYVMVSLRTARGVDTNRLKERFAERYAVHFDRAAERFLNNGLLVRRENRVAIPAEHFLVSDAVIEDLFVASE